MMGITRSFESPNFNIPFRYVFGLIVAAVVAWVVFGSHATDRHGASAEEVRNCIDNGGTIEAWFNPETNREAIICVLPDGEYGIQIREGGREVTSFIKDKLSRLEQVLNYLRNRGYGPNE